MSRALASICVFCGARNGANPSHVTTARALGALIAAEGWRLVYGAGDVGLMGEVARNKALAVALGKVTVVDTDGKPVDLSIVAIIDSVDVNGSRIFEKFSRG